MLLPAAVAAFKQQSQVLEKIQSILLIQHSFFDISLLNTPEQKPLPAEMFQHLLQSRKHPGCCLDTVVKNHYGSRADMPDSPGSHLLRTSVHIEIPTEDVPHHDTVLSAQVTVSPHRKLTVRRTEQGGADVVGGFLYVGKVGGMRSTEAPGMGVGMIACRVPLLQQTVVQFRILLHPAADAEEGGFGLVAEQ